jgi:hypothetical protein
MNIAVFYTKSPFVQYLYLFMKYEHQTKGLPRRFRRGEVKSRNLPLEFAYSRRICCLNSYVIYSK